MKPGDIIKRVSDRLKENILEREISIGELKLFENPKLCICIN